MESSNFPSVKQPTTFEEQLEIFKRRGLVVSDADFAIRTLQRISYYRLSAYTLSLKKSDQFYPNTTFENVVALYEFDRRFRYLIMEMVEQVEIAFRAHISYHIAHTYGPLGHLDQEQFDNHESFLTELEKEIHRSNEYSLSIILKGMMGKYQFGSLLRYYRLERYRSYILT